MAIQQIAIDFFVSSQLFPNDVPQLAEIGIKTVICNRPDGERTGQPGFALIENAAQQAGLKFKYVPIIPGQVGKAEVDAFAEAIEEINLPALGYYGTGKRSMMMWNHVKGA